MNSDEYRPRQARRDWEYETAWQSPEVKAWLASLTPEERRLVVAQGLHKPLLQKHGSGMSDCDLADSSLASEEPDYIAQIEPEQVATEVDQESSDDKIMDVLRRLLAEVMSQGNVMMTLECLTVACGMNMVNGDSMSLIAKRYGVTRAAVSKRCVDITQRLNLPPSRAMRSLKARTIYRKTQLKLSKKDERTHHHRK